MAHRDLHPEPVEDCFGCKVQAVRFDSGIKTTSITDENNTTITQHRDGRQDVTVRPETAYLTSKVKPPE